MKPISPLASADVTVTVVETFDPRSGLLNAPIAGSEIQQKQVNKI
jgi:hypothetical protein